MAVPVFASNSLVYREVADIVNQILVERDFMTFDADQIFGRNDPTERRRAEERKKALKEAQDARRRAAEERARERAAAVPLPPSDPSTPERGNTPPRNRNR